MRFQSDLIFLVASLESASALPEQRSTDVQVEINDISRTADTLGTVDKKQPQA
jgi:hypothetical protein